MTPQDSLKVKFHKPLITKMVSVIVAFLPLLSCAASLPPGGALFVETPLSDVSSGSSVLMAHLKQVQNGATTVDVSPSISYVFLDDGSILDQNQPINTASNPYCNQYDPTIVKTASVILCSGTTKTGGAGTFNQLAGYYTSNGKTQVIDYIGQTGSGYALIDPASPGKGTTQSLIDYATAIANSINDPSITNPVIGVGIEGGVAVLGNDNNVTGAQITAFYGTLAKALAAVTPKKYIFIYEPPVSTADQQSAWTAIQSAYGNIVWLDPLYDTAGMDLKPWAWTDYTASINPVATNTMQLQMMYMIPSAGSEGSWTRWVDYSGATHTKPYPTNTNIKVIPCEPQYTGCQYEYKNITLTDGDQLDYVQSVLTDIANLTPPPSTNPLFAGIVLWDQNRPVPTTEEWIPNNTPDNVFSYFNTWWQQNVAATTTITIGSVQHLPGAAPGTFYASVGWTISQPAPADSSFQLYVNDFNDGTWTFTQFPATGPYSAYWGKNGDAGNHQIAMNIGTSYVGYIRLVNSTGNIIASASAPILGYTINVSSVSYELHGSTYDAPVSWTISPNPPANSTLRLYVNTVSDGTWSFTKFPATGPYSAYWGKNGDSGNNEMTMNTGTQYVGHIDLLDSNGNVIGTASAPLSAQTP